MTENPAPVGERPTVPARLSRKKRWQVFFVTFIVVAVTAALVDWIGVQMGFWTADRPTKYIGLAVTISTILTFVMPNSRADPRKVDASGQGGRS